MSVHKYLDLFCDDCGNWERTGARTIMGARREWAKKGWVRKVVGGRLMDLCPACAAKPRDS